MKVSDLQSTFIEELKTLLPDWKFVKSHRHFKKEKNGAVLLFHISCINHEDDFDAVGDVAIEFKSGKEPVCVIGVELGNITGVGQKRFQVANVTDTKFAAKGLVNYFNQHGLPFLELFSNPSEVLATLESGGNEAMLISPLVNQHQEQINRLRVYCGVST